MRDSVTVGKRGKFWRFQKRNSLFPEFCSNKLKENKAFKNVALFRVYGKEQIIWIFNQCHISRVPNPNGRIPHPFVMATAVFQGLPQPVVQHLIQPWSNT